MIFADVISPKGVNSRVNSATVISRGRLPTKTLIPLDLALWDITRGFGIVPPEDIISDLGYGEAG
jgi:hypothetical protein